MESMGNKVQARKTMVAAGAPVIPGSEGRVDSADDVRAWGEYRLLGAEPSAVAPVLEFLR